MISLHNTIIVIVGISSICFNYSLLNNISIIYVLKYELIIINIGMTVSNCMQGTSEVSNKLFIIINNKWT